MKFIPKYITTDILAEYGEHLTHEAYNEMVKLNSSQGDYNTKVLNQLFNTDEGIPIPYLDNKIKKVTDDQDVINEDMEQVVADMAALAGSLSKYSTIIETRRMIQYATQNFVKTNKIKAGENIEVEVDALNNVIISAIGGGEDVTKAYVDEQDTITLQSSKEYTDTKISQIPMPVIPTNISAFNNDVGYITGYTETDPIFSASAAAGITSQNITDWDNKLSVETDPIFGASPAAGIESSDIINWNNKSDFSGNYSDLNDKPDLSVYVDKTSTQSISGSKLFTTIPQTNQTPTDNHHITNKQYVDSAVLEHYSTTETRIGTWINNKPLYRIVVPLGTLPNEAAIDIQTGFTSTYGTVRRFECYGYNSQLSAVIIITSQYQKPNLHIRSSAYIDYVKVTAAGNWSAWDGYAVLEYTKASD